MSVRNAAAIVSLLGWCGLVAAGCSSFYEIPIETPIQPKMDVSAFQRVLVAGFIAGGTDDVDANLETVRLLRSQLRTKSALRVIEADLRPLIDAEAAPAADGASAPPAPVPPIGAAENGSAAEAKPAAAADKPVQAPTQLADPRTPAEPKIHNEKDLQRYDKIFADVSYWKKLGEEYQNPLIVTGTVLFMPQQSSGFVTREQEVYDAYGRRRVIPVRAYMERKGFVLVPKFIFIDGRTGTTLYSETFREEVLYSADQNTPALSSYFELMDRVLPSFLGALSTQKIRGTRVLLK